MGRLKEFDPADGKHKVKFDDGEEKWYNLHSAKTTYKFVKDSTVLSPWYPPSSVDEAPYFVAVPGVNADGAVAVEPMDADQPDQPADDEQDYPDDQQDGNNNQYAPVHDDQGQFSDGDTMSSEDDINMR